MTTARVRAAYTPTEPAPLAVRAGEAVRAGARDEAYPLWLRAVAADGRAAYIPEPWFELRGEEAIARRDYDARELAVAGGETVTVLEALGGWSLVATTDGRTGWLPDRVLAAPHGSRTAAFGTSVFTEMTRLATEHGAINLGQGFPDFDGPAFVREAAERALAAGHNQYAPPFGLPALQDAIAADRRSRYGLDYDARAEVTVTAGATEAIFAAVQALCGPGDEILVLDPAYDSYRPAIALAGARAVAVPLLPPLFALDAGALEAAVTARTRGLVFNSPHNPLGKVFTRDELSAVADVCRRHDLVVISDEAYEHLVYEDALPHIPIATLPGMRERTVMIGSAGKTFGFTGWKVGHACAPPALTGPLRLVHQYVTFTNGTPFQHAVAEGLAAGEAYFATFAAEYRARRDLLSAGLARAGYGVFASAGTYFVVTDIRPLGLDDGPAFCRELPARRGVAAIPVAAFCADPEPFRHLVRFAFCKRDETLRAALQRLGA